MARATRGEASVLELDAPPRPLLRALLDEGALGKALLMLERDGEHGRVSVLPRRTVGSPALAEWLEADHARLDDLADQMTRNVHLDPMRTIVLAHLLSAGMRRHVTAEESILFPVYESHFGGRGAATATMEREHRAMLHYLERMLLAAQRMLHAAERQSAASDLLRVLRALGAVVAEHRDKEERTLFPLLDRTLPEDRRSELLQQIVLF